MRTLFLFGLLFSPTIVFAACTSKDSTVVYINGILADYSEAQKELKSLQTEYISRIGDYSVTFLNAYNPSHLAGAGDLIETASQLLNSPVSEYDLDTMLIDLHDELTTRRVLLLGYSQGALYSNAIYDYLLAHGEPREAVGVYQIATPAHAVAGGGAYLTSRYDVAIQAVAQLAVKLGVQAPLPPNIALAYEPSADSGTMLAGHSLEGDYLASAPDRIVADIAGELKGLEPTDSSQTGDCFTSPPQSLSYEAQQATFAIADPVALALRTGVVDAYTIAADAADGASIALVYVQNFFSSPVPVPAVSASATSTEVKNFQVVKSLYGSSLSPGDVENLLNSPNAQNGAAAVLAAAPPLAQPAATSTSASSTPPDIVQVTISTSTPASATSTIAAPAVIIATPSAVNTGPEVAIAADISIDDNASSSEATSTEEDATTTPPIHFVGGSPVADSFDSFNALNWQTFGDGGVNFNFDDGSVGPCVSGGCIVGATTSFNGVPRTYVESDVALSEGAFTIYAKAASGFIKPGPIIAVCPLQSNCNDGSQGVGISFVNRLPIDGTWHQYYVAWRQGTSTVLACFLQDDTDAQDCTWEYTNQPAGTTFDGVALWSQSGYHEDAGDNLWFDELAPAEGL